MMRSVWISALASALLLSTQANGDDGIASVKETVSGEIPNEGITNRLLRDRILQDQGNMTDGGIPLDSGPGDDDNNGGPSSSCVAQTVYVNQPASNSTSRSVDDVVIRRPFCGGATQMARFVFTAPSAGIYFFHTTGSACADTVMVYYSHLVSNACDDDPASISSEDHARCRDDFFDEGNKYAAMMVEMQQNEVATVMVGSFEDECGPQANGVGLTVTLSVQTLMASPEDEATSAPSVPSTLNGEDSAGDQGDGAPSPTGSPSTATNATTNVEYEYEYEYEHESNKSDSSDAVANGHRRLRQPMNGDDRHRWF